MNDWDNLTFVTGNADKAAYLQKYLGVELKHQAVDIPEIQSLDLKEVVTAKAKAAYAEIGGPVLVEDASLRFTALGRLPGVYVKWFVDEMGLEKVCRVLDSFDDRSATGEVMYCLHNGAETHYFYADMPGRVADHPRGSSGFGYDPLFIHDGMDETRGELSTEELERRSPRLEALKSLKTFLTEGS